MVYFSVYDSVSMVILVIQAYLPMLVNSSFPMYAMENLVSRTSVHTMSLWLNIFIYSPVLLWRLKFSHIPTKQTPHGSPARARYGVTDSCTTLVSPALYKSVHHMGPRRNGTGLYIISNRDKVLFRSGYLLWIVNMITGFVPDRFVFCKFGNLHWDSRCK